MPPAFSASRAGVTPEASGHGSSGTLANKMKPLLLATIVFAASQYLACSEDTFVYTASPWQVVRYNNDLIIGFNFRVKGEMYRVTDVRFPENSKFRIFFDERIKQDELEYCYFELITKRKIPRKSEVALPHLDIITKETTQDLLGYLKSRSPALFENALSDEMIVSVRRITQNEYLQINPKIVPDPNKTK
jgi:hypothetical protein